jgi:hypothetical protein
VEARVSEVIDDAWLRVEPVRVGGVARGVGTPDRYVTVSDGGDLILRVDVYAYPLDSFPFEAALVWRDNLVIGFGSHIHMVALATRAACTLELESYYGHLHPTPDYLLIASGDRLFRMEPDRSILWTTEVLAVDGVIVSDPGPPVIRGEAELDPPGGWQPFAVSAADGATVR